MRILIVASYNSSRFSPFVLEQSKEISKVGVEVELFGVVGKGVRGYYDNRVKLIKRIKKYQPNIIHAHYGLSGLLANMQRKVPVITTYHGSDIHSCRWILLLSKIAMYLSKYNIFVGQSLYNISKYKKKNYSILSCGLDLSIIKPFDSFEARKLLKLDNKKIYILFAGSFDNPIKNYSLAKRSVSSIERCELIELRGYKREDVNLLMNACDLLLTTSYRESGPLVVKEAMACNLPVVTTDVGDVKWVIGDTEGCYITSYNIDDCTALVKKAINFSTIQKKTNGRNRIIEIELDNRIVVRKLIAIYDSIIVSNSGFPLKTSKRPK